MRSNAMSVFGRMSYAAHLAVYPAAGAFYLYVLKPWKAARDAAADAEELAKESPARAVDPDIFNPFTPIPFHNNPESTYTYANVNMRHYISQNTHFNAADYTYKNYYDCYDHGNKKSHLYNWTSL